MVSSAADTRTPAQLCADKTTEAQVVSTRHAYCVRMAVNYPLLNSKGQEIGHSLVAIVAMAKFDEKSSAGGKWTEHITALTAEMTPNVGGVTLSFRSMCSGGCTTSGPAWGGAAPDPGQGRGRELDHRPRPHRGAAWARWARSSVMRPTTRQGQAEQMTDLGDGQVDRVGAAGGAVRVGGPGRCRVGCEGGEEGEREHGKGDVPVPGGPVADLVVARQQPGESP
ncbi:hypothetical protein ACIGW6_33615 [Kitasatospora aureofaciens]|uniref:hypothetical protein n=1 Tax=Kitasatospora aureofaciens TaxID=1894 RepID=UPI0037C7BF4C